MYLVPLTAIPLQTQNFTHDGHDLTLTTRWNSVSKFINIDLFDNVTQETLTLSEALTVGSATCAHLQLPFVFMLVDESGLGTAPIDLDDIGDRINLYIVNKEDYHAAIRASNTVNYR